MGMHSDTQRFKIGIVGSGIAGMSAAWLLSRSHDVTVFEKDDRIGGHSNTVEIDSHRIDTGFIVYNEKNYPNLIALFEHLGVATARTDMSFGVSVDAGDFEYAGSDLAGLLAQKRNILRPRFWYMTRDILRFYKDAPAALDDPRFASMSLGEYLDAKGYSESFRRDHLLPMGAAIWSTPVDTMLTYPLAAFIRFCDNHGLLQITDRPQWRTVTGGSRSYVDALTAPVQNRIYLNRGVARVGSDGASAFIEDRRGYIHCFDHVVLASHADQTLQVIDNPEPAERKLLGAFSYQPNKAILHTDRALMPKNRKAWSSWNYIKTTDETVDAVCVTYWMNRLQKLPGKTDYFVTLNPTQNPAEGSIIRSFLYHHPTFDRDAMAAQRLLWNIQGTRRLWYCGSYFGYGFHEDALQSGLAVAEALGGVRRPWSVENESGRIYAPKDLLHVARLDAA